MNDQSQIEAKIIHLTPPQRFQVAHQLPKDRPAVPTQVSQPSKGEEFKVITTNPSKIWAIRLLNGTWLLVTLFLKRCTRIDKNLLVVYVALVLLLLQVFMVIARAEAGPQNRRIFSSEYNLSPLIAAGRPSTFWLDPKSTKKIKVFPKVPWARDPARLLSARAEGCFHLVPGEGECRGLQPKALSAHRPASDSKPGWHLPYRQASLSYRQASLPYRQAGCRKARRNYEGGCRAVTPVSVVFNVYERSDMSAFARPSLAPVNERGNHQPVVIAHITGDVSQTKPVITKTANLIADWQHTRIAPTLTPFRNRQFTSYDQAIDRTSVTLAKNPPWQLRLAPTCPGTRFKAAGAAAALFAYFFQLQGNLRLSGSLHAIEKQYTADAKSMTRGSENVNPSSLLHSAVNRCEAPVINSSTIYFKTN